MKESNSIDWVVKLAHPQFGDVRLRLGKNYENNIALSISTLCEGVIRGTYHDIENIDDLTNKSPEELEYLVEQHIGNLSKIIKPTDNKAFERDWFNVIDSKSLGKCLIDVDHLDRKITIVTFTEADQRFWSISVSYERFYELGLEEYECELDKLMLDMNEEILKKLCNKGLDEEDMFL